MYVKPLNQPTPLPSFSAPSIPCFLLSPGPFLFTLYLCHSPFISFSHSSLPYPEAELGGLRSAVRSPSKSEQSPQSNAFRHILGQNAFDDKKRICCSHRREDQNSSVHHSSLFARRLAVWRSGSTLVSDQRSYSTPGPVVLGWVTPVRGSTPGQWRIQGVGHGAMALPNHHR